MKLQEDRNRDCVSAPSLSGHLGERPVLGSIRLEVIKKFWRHFATDFTNPDS